MTMIHGYRLNLTCAACPEQYDVYDENGTQVAYLRLRHGRFTATVPDAGGQLVYKACPQGDGIFDANERYKYLNAAIKAVIKHQLNQQVDVMSGEESDADDAVW